MTPAPVRVPHEFVVLSVGVTLKMLFGVAVAFWVRWLQPRPTS